MTEIQSQLLGDQHSDDYTITKAEITSSRGYYPLDIINVISEFEVYESIEKSYLTGRIVISDQMGIYDRFDFDGTEILDIEITRNISGSTPINKKFILSNVENTKKSNETNEAIQFHLIEDIIFKSALTNVNKSYSGQPQEIIAQILKEYLNKNLLTNAFEDIQASMKVIIPNLDPIEALTWIRNRATTSKGYPFFLYSTLASNDVFFTDIGTLLEQKILNDRYPFTYLPGVGSSSATGRLFQIFEYEYRNVENNINLISNGVVGANHNFYDVTTAKYDKIKFNVHKDLYRNVSKLNPRQPHPVLDEFSEYEDVKISDYESKNMFHIHSTLSQGRRIKSYSEEYTATEHKLKVIAQAAKLFMTRNPIEITVNGREFISGNDTYSIGNNFRILFKSNIDQNERPLIDTKKSGDYLVHAAKHSFRNGRIFSRLLCSKITNYESNDWPDGVYT